MTLARLLVTHGHHFGCSYRLFDRATIGRSSECTLQLLDEKVSRVHSRVDRDDEFFIVQDAGSSNGTGLNGRRLEAPKVLEPGDEIAVGSNLLMFEPSLEILRDLSGSGSVLVLPPPERAAPAQAESDRPPKEVGAEGLTQALSSAIGGPRGLGRGPSLLEALATHLGADRAALIRCDAEGGQKEAVATYPAQGRVGLRADHLQSAVKKGAARLRKDGLVEHAIKQARSVVIGQVGSTLYIPLRLEGQVRGLFFASVASPDGFDYIDLEALSAAASIGFATFLGLNPFSHTSNPGKSEPESPVARSSGMQEALNRARSLAKSDLPMLLEGPPGVGKAFIGRYIHHSSPRSHGPYLAERCDSIGGNNSEQNLFGKESNGKESARRGLFDEVNGGTLCLDAIERMDLSLQKKVLRVIQEERFFRVGGVRPVRCKTRIILGTSKAIDAVLEDGSLLSDLYNETRGQRLTLPSLNDRTADIEPLIKRFIARFNRQTGARMKGFSGEAIERLEGHEWTENVRELQECVDRLLRRAEGEVVTAEEVDAELAASVYRGVRGANLARALATLERKEIQRCLERAEGDQARAAAILGRPEHRLMRHAALLGVELPKD